MTTLLLLLALARADEAPAAPAPAPAAVKAPKPLAVDRPHAVIGLGLGAVLPTSAPPSAFVLPRLEVGVTLPVVGGRLQPFLTGQWAGLPVTGAGDDPRVPGGTWTYAGTHHEGHVGGGLLARFLPLDAKGNGYLSLAGIAAVHRTILDGEAEGNAFGTYDETSVGGGLLAEVGGELRLGPGRLVLGVQLGWAPIDGTLPGKRDLVLLTPIVGYRFVP